MALILAWNDEQDILPISPKFAEKLEELLKLAGEEEGVEDGEVALTFVDDETIHELNRTYRNIDRPTDVLSFAMLEQGEDEPAILYGEEEPDEDSVEGDADADGKKALRSRSAISSFRFPGPRRRLTNTAIPWSVNSDFYSFTDFCI